MATTMEKYYILEDVVDDELSVFMIYANAEQEALYWRGWLVPNDEAPDRPRIMSEYERDSYPDYMGISLSFVISARFAHVLTQASVNNIELFSCDHSALGPGPEYHILNICGVVDAVDRDKSVYSQSGSRFIRMHSLMLDPVKASGFRMFRLWGYPHVVVIDHILHDVLKDSRLSGFRVTPADGWSDQHRL